MTVPDRLPSWMTDKAGPVPAWCRGGGEPEFTSYLLDTGASVRELKSPTVKVTEELTLHLGQTEEALYGRVTRSPVRVVLWGRDCDLPFNLTAEQAHSLGVALLEHAVRLRVIEEAQGT